MPWPSNAEACQIAFDAYVYGYSLLSTQVTRVQMTNVAKPAVLYGSWVPPQIVKSL
jgi:hypothetical protein